MLLNELTPLILSVLFCHGLGVHEALLIHFGLKILVSKAFHEVEFKFEDAHGSEYCLALVQALASVILSDLSYLPQVLPQKSNVPIERNQFQSPVFRILRLDNRLVFVFPLRPSSLPMDKVIDILRFFLLLVPFVIDLEFLCRSGRGCWCEH